MDVLRDAAPASSRLGDRWLAVGQSGHEDSALAARSALGACGRSDASLLLVFAGRSHNLAAVGAALRAAAPGVPVAGVTSAGEIVADGPADDSVVVVALGGDGLSISTSAAAVDGSLRDAAASAAACIGDVADRPHQALILFCEDADHDHRELVRGAYSVAGAAVPLVGGCVAPARLGGPCLVHDDEAYRDAVIAIAIGSDAPIGAAVRHGMSPIGEPMFVSAAAGCDVLSFDDAPALDAYLDRAGLVDADRDDADAFRELVRRRPLGVRGGGGAITLRGPASTKPDGTALTLAAPLAPGTLAWVMDGTPENVLSATDEACAAALAPLGGRAPKGLLVFDCVARRAVLGDALGDEVARIAAAADGAPVAGLYTEGEVARTVGISGFHNQTIVVLALG